MRPLSFAEEEIRSELLARLDDTLFGNDVERKDGMTRRVIYNNATTTRLRCRRRRLILDRHPLELSLSAQMWPRWTKVLVE